MTEFESYRHLFANYSWTIEEHEAPSFLLTKALLEIKFSGLNPKDLVFVDVGCQKGIYSKGLSDNFPQSAIFAYDVLAHPEMLNLANDNFNILFQELAIGNGDEAICMIHCDSKTVIHRPTVKLDVILTRGINYLKIDIDGNHAQVIKGSLNLLTYSSPLVMIEMSVNIMHSSDPADMINMIRRNGNSEDIIALRALSSIGYKLIAVRNGMNCFFVKAL